MTEHPRFKVVVTDQVFPSLEVERSMLASIDAEVAVADGTADGVAHLAVDADALLNTYLPIDAGLISQLSRCRIVARYGIGVDNIDIPAANAAGIVVTNVPDYCVEEVATHALALMLAILRRLPTADAAVRAGGWGLAGLRPIRRLSDLTYGLVGYGRIARLLAASIAAFDGRVLAYDPYLAAGADLPELVDLDELTARCDVISIHAPATSDTRGMFDAARIAAMRPGAILINTSRGPLIVLEALVDALRGGHLGGAGIDVFPTEPPAIDELADVPNLVLTPHMAYYSEASLAESQRKAATQVIKVLRGEPPDYPLRV